MQPISNLKGVSNSRVADFSPNHCSADIIRSILEGTTVLATPYRLPNTIDMDAESYTA